MVGHGRAPFIIGAVTAVVAVLAAVAITAAMPGDERSLAVVNAPVQLLISIGVPFLAAVMTSDLRPRGPEVLSTILRALVLAVAFALFGAIVTAAAVAAFPSPMADGRWSAAPVSGSVVVQVVAVLIGTGLGLLIRRPVLASLSTIVFPLGLWLLLGVLAPAARAWLTPFESASKLLAGTMTTASWLPFAVMVAIWAMGPNVAGYRRLVHPALREEDETSLGPASPA